MYAKYGPPSTCTFQDMCKVKVFDHARRTDGHTDNQTTWGDDNTQSAYMAEWVIKSGLWLLIEINKTLILYSKDFPSYSLKFLDAISPLGG